MLFVFAFIGIFLCSIAASATGNCPENSIGLKLNSSICYSFHPSLSQYVIAERECNSFGATVISIKNKFTNVYVSQLANLFFKHLEVEEIWTSGHRLLNDKTYQWVDGDAIENLNYYQQNRFIDSSSLESPREFNFELPREASVHKFHQNENDCVAINLEKGFWKPTDCFSRLPFVCEFVGSEVQKVPPTAAILKDFMNENEQQQTYISEIIIKTSDRHEDIEEESDGWLPNDVSVTSTLPTSPTSPPPPSECPETWSYNNVTEFCYTVFGNMNWTDAEAKCIEEEAHLASIHSQDEAAFVAALANPITMNHGAFNLWIGQPYIGLFTNDSNANWYWSDGTAVDYTSWRSTEPSSEGEENCGQIWSGDDFTDYIDEVQPHDFNNIRCSEVCNFICKKSPRAKY